MKTKLTPASARLNKTALVLALAASTFTFTVPAHAQVNLSAVAAGTGGFAITGRAANDQLARFVGSAGDFNNDGILDYIVGAENSDTPPGNNGGEAYIVFGVTSGSVAALSTIAATSGAAGGFYFPGTSASERIGSSVAALGDVNGDGIDDVAIGGRGVSTGGGRNTNGETYILFGRTTPAGTISRTAVAAGTGGFVIRGAASNDQLGDAVARGGDVNDDGLNDVVIGSPRSNPGGLNNAGAAFIIFGKTTGTAVEASAISLGNGGWVINGSVTQDRTGTAVSAGQDVNGDGFDDIVVGANAADPNGSASGEAYLIFGKSTTTAVNVSAIKAGSGGGFVIRGGAADQQAGISVSLTGDMNGDGLAEVLVGSQPAAGNGAAAVVFGRTAVTPVQLSALGAAGFAMSGAAAGDQFGIFVSRVGDMNGDGRADVIVGAPLNDATAVDAGTSYVIFGKSTTTLVAATNVSGSVGFQIRGQVTLDQAGFSASSVGDVNADGIQDAIVGAHLTDFGGGASGRAYVVYSPITPPTTGTYVSATGAGNPQNEPIGGLDNAGDPDSRVAINYGAGSTAGLTTAILNRSKSGISGLEVNKLASVFWVVSSTVTFSDARITFNYLDSELTGIVENQLRIYKSPDADGPWTPVSNITLNTASNTISGDITSFSHFVLVDSTVLSVKLSAFDADVTGSGVDISWTTESETDTVGFYIRVANADGTPGARVSNTIIPAVGGGTYNLSDPSGDNQTVYLLEEITITGESLYYGPVGGNTTFSSVVEWSNF